MAKTPDKKLPPPQISVLECIREGYEFISQNFMILLKAGGIAIVFNVIFSGLVFGLTDTDDSALTGRSFFGDFLITLPATVVFAWYAFVQARLQIFGENFQKLPHDRDYRRQRTRALNISIPCFVLFQMGVTVFYTYITAGTASVDGAAGLRPGQMFVALSGLFILFWGLKFSVLHLVAAAEGDLKDYLSRVRGLWFSFFLIGLGFISILPVMLIFMFIFVLLNPVSENGITPLTIIVLGSVLSWFMAVVLNAVGVAALKYLYKGQRKA